MALTDVASAADFDALLASSPFTACHYWASWCDPCAAMDQLMREMAASRPNVRFVRVEAEEVDELAERYDVSAVPYFTFHHKTTLVDKLEGADAKALASKVQQHFGAATVAPPAAAAATAAPAAAPAVDLNTRLTQLTTKAPVMLFMKGTKARIFFLFFFFFFWREKKYKKRRRRNCFRHIVLCPTMFSFFFCLFHLIIPCRHCVVRSLFSRLLNNASTDPARGTSPGAVSAARLSPPSRRLACPSRLSTS